MAGPTISKSKRGARKVRRREGKGSFSKGKHEEESKRRVGTKAGRVSESKRDLEQSGINSQSNTFGETRSLSYFSILEEEDLKNGFKI